MHNRPLKRQRAHSSPTTKPNSTKQKVDPTRRNIPRRRGLVRSNPGRRHFSAQDKYVAQRAAENSRQAVARESQRGTRQDRASSNGREQAELQRRLREQMKEAARRKFIDQQVSRFKREVDFLKPNEKETLLIHEDGFVDTILDSDLKNIKQRKAAVGVLVAANEKLTLEQKAMRKMLIDMGELPAGAGYDFKRLSLDEDGHIQKRNAREYESIKDPDQERLQKRIATAFEAVPFWDLEKARIAAENKAIDKVIRSYVKQYYPSYLKELVDNQLELKHGAGIVPFDRNRGTIATTSAATATTTTTTGTASAMVANGKSAQTAVKIKEHETSAETSAEQAGNSKFNPRPITQNPINEIIQLLSDDMFNDMKAYTEEKAKNSNTKVPIPIVKPADRIPEVHAFATPDASDNKDSWYQSPIMIDGDRVTGIEISKDDVFDQLKIAVPKFVTLSQGAFDEVWKCYGTVKYKEHEKAKASTATGSVHGLGGKKLEERQRKLRGEPLKQQKVVSMPEMPILVNHGKSFEDLLKEEGLSLGSDPKVAAKKLMQSMQKMQDDAKKALEKKAQAEAQKAQDEADATKPQTATATTTAPTTTNEDGTGEKKKLKRRRKISPGTKPDGNDQPNDLSARELDPWENTNTITTNSVTTPPAQSSGNFIDFTQPDVVVPPLTHSHHRKSTHSSNNMFEDFIHHNQNTSLTPPSTPDDPQDDFDAEISTAPKSITTSTSLRRSARSGTASPRLANRATATKSTPESGSDDSSAQYDVVEQQLIKDDKLVDKLLNHDTEPIPTPLSEQTLDNDSDSTSITSSSRSLRQNSATRGRNQPSTQLHSAAQHSHESLQPQMAKLEDNDPHHATTTRTMFRERGQTGRLSTATPSQTQTQTQNTPTQNTQPDHSAPEPASDTDNTQSSHTQSGSATVPPTEDGTGLETDVSSPQIPPKPPAPAPQRKKSPSEINRERDLWYMIRQIQKDEQGKVKTEIEDTTLKTIKAKKVTEDRSNYQMPTFFTAHVSPNLSTDNHISDFSEFGHQMDQKM